MVKFHVEQINGDNRRPGMPTEGYLVRYNLSNYGWMNCATFSTLAEAEEFVRSLNSND